MFFKKNQLLLVSVLLACSMLCGVSSAQALDLDSPKDSDSQYLEIEPVYDFGAGQSTYTGDELYQKTAEFWTPDKIEQAESEPLNVVPGWMVDGANLAEELQYYQQLLSAFMAPIIVSKPVSSSISVRGTAEKLASYNISAANGKIYFQNSKTGRFSECSGAAVNSESKTIVITAAHCVHEGKNGGSHKNWIFIPDFNPSVVVNDPSTMPYGFFLATGSFILNDWANADDGAARWSRDVAFVTTHNNRAGQKLVEAVGGYGLGIGGKYQFQSVAIGYPSNFDNGKKLTACKGSTFKLDADTSHPLHAMSCPFGAGASGGPWVFNHDDSTGSGLVRSVTSAATYPPKHIVGPFFDAEVYSLFQLAENKNK